MLSGRLTFDNGCRPCAEPIHAPLDIVLDLFHELFGFVRQAPGANPRVYIVEMVEHNAARIVCCYGAPYQTGIETTNATNFASDRGVFPIVKRQSGFLRDALPGCLPH